MKAHAQALPYLAYLLAASQEIPVLSSHGSVMVCECRNVDAVSAVPKSAARHLARAIKALEQHLPPTATSAWDILQAITLALLS
jgi:hypothetical protein